MPQCKVTRIRESAGWLYMPGLCRARFAEESEREMRVLMRVPRRESQSAGLRALSPRLPLARVFFVFFTSLFILAFSPEALN